MKRWKMQYEEAGAMRKFEFESDETPTLAEGAKRLRIALSEAGRDFLIPDRPRGAGEDPLHTLSSNGITVLEPKPSDDDLDSR